jgi:hypothetical protein
MRITRRTEIWIETEEVLLVKWAGRSRTGWCVECQEEVRLVTADEAAMWAGVSSRAMYRQVEESRVHFAETPEGWLLICLKSVGEGSVGIGANQAW